MSDDEAQSSYYTSTGTSQGDVLTIANNVVAINLMREKPRGRKKSGRGKGYTTVENMMVCKAWVAASCDPKNGSKQALKDFEDSIGLKYKEIKEEQEECDAAQRASNAIVGMVAAPGRNIPIIVAYPYRSGTSVLEQFKRKISPDVLKWMGVLELTNDGEPKYKSGEDYEHWIERMLEIFFTKEGKAFEYRECWEWLKDQPKFSIWKAESDVKRERIIKRPAGNKKAKQDEKEEKVIDKVISKLGVSTKLGVAGGGGGNAGGGGAGNGAAVGGTAFGGIESIAATLKDFVKMGETFMMSQLMGMDKDNIDLYTSANQKRKYASSLLRLQAAQMEHQAIALEQQNESCRKTRKDNGGARLGESSEVPQCVDLTTTWNGGGEDVSSNSD
jgi:hypothetical protein